MKPASYFFFTVDIKEWVYNKVYRYLLLFTCLFIIAQQTILSLKEKKNKVTKEEHKIKNIYYTKLN